MSKNQKSGDRSLPYGEGFLEAPASWNDAVWCSAAASTKKLSPARITEISDDFAGRIADLCSGGHLALVVPDRTRPLPLRNLLPAISHRVTSLHERPRSLSIVVASGMHRPLPAAEYRQALGVDTWPRQAALFVHDCRAEADLLGHVHGGVPVSAHPSVARADAVGILGGIVFHYLAGFGGGRKMLLPGVAARRSILDFHRRCLSDEPGGGRHEAARQGVLDGNPLHETSLAAASLFPPTLAMHFLLGPNASLSDIYVGNLTSDYRRACSAYAAERTFTCEEPFDAAVICAGSAAEGFDLVQAQKALDAVVPIVRDDGAIVLIAQCPGGMGNPELAEGLALGTTTEIETRLRRTFRVGWNTALSLRMKTNEKRVAIVCEIDDDALADSGMKPLHSIEEAESWLQENTRGDASVFISPFGARFRYRLESSPEP